MSINMLLVICALGCAPASTDFKDEHPSQTDTDPFLAHLGSIDLINENPDVVGAVTIDDPRNEKVVRFVDYLASKGIRLQYYEEEREWRVVAPTFGAYFVKVESIRAFPDGATLHEMQVGCLAINLAHGLNPDAQLIMSLPGLRYTADSSKQPKNTLTVEEVSKQTMEIRLRPEYITLERKLKQLFIEYEP